ncbi:MAG: hypothetical protein WA978_17120 [Sphingopyxis granuli]|uniref:hypothetical protein n=1 Tax=Sphingopyxis granuli TaxID=267128 RepID=UPI003C78E889
MRGRILGFQEEAGVIQGDDDARYSFTRTDWRDAGDPQRGTLVDFVVEDGGAREIYIALGSKAPGAGALKPAPNLSDASAISEEIVDKFRAASTRDDAIGDLLGRLKLAPQMLLAALILFAAFSMTFMSTGFNYENGRIHKDLRYLAAGGDHTLLDVPSAAGDNQAGVETTRASIAKELDQQGVTVAGEFGDSPEVAQLQRAVGKVNAAMDKFDNIMTLSKLVWLVPLLALLTIAAGWMRNAMVKPLGTALGVVSCASTFIPYLWEKQTIALLEAAMTMTMVRDDVNFSALKRAIEKSIALQGGGWLILLLGAGCIYLGVAKRRAAAD